MPQFIYLAMNKDNRPINGMIEAADRNAALASLKKEDLKPVSLRENSAATNLGKLTIFKSGMKSKDLVLFTRQLSTMVSAGVPLVRALNTLQQQTDSTILQKALEIIVRDVQAGASLGDAFAKHPGIFNDVYINMIRAGEAAGILDDILKRLALQQEKNDAMRKRIRSAMIYPIVLLVITVGAFFGLMLFVVPQIGAIIKDLGNGADLPPLTQAMLDVSHFMQNYWYIIIIAIIVIVVFLQRYIGTPAGKARFHELILRVPGIGSLIRKIAVARFARTFAALMGAGVSVLEALQVTGRAIGNTSYERELAKARESVKNGKELSETLKNNAYFPPIISQMLAVGEETGRTDTVLIKVADFYETEVDAMIEGLSSIIEPVMIVIMGAVVGLIAISVIGPISGLAQNIQ